MIYGFGAIGDLPIAAAPIAGAVLFWDETEPPVVVVNHRKRRKFYTRERDNLNIYWQADDIDLKLEPEKPKRKDIKVVKRPVEAPKAKPDEVVPLAQIEALAREYDEMQAYQRAMQQKQWAQLARLYERLQDEADVEFLLAHA
jgi:hypothetical protein